MNLVLEKPREGSTATLETFLLTDAEHLVDDVEKLFPPCVLDVCDGSGWIGSLDPQDSDRQCACRDTEDSDNDI